MPRLPRVHLPVPAVLLAAVLPAVALAGVPDFKSGGFVLGLQYGAGLWTMDANHVEAQVGLRDPFGPQAFVDDLTDGHAVNLHAGYTILGHATVGLDFTATGWDLFDSGRGGAGFLAGRLAWHPLQLVYALLQRERTLGLDVNTSLGVGYGIAGERRGMDGLVLQWGLEADWYLARFFGVGLFARGTFLQWDKYYLDFNNRAAAGNTVELPQRSGGAFWMLGLTLNFRAGD